MSLFRSRTLAEVVKLNSYWIKVDPKSNDTVLVRKGHPDVQGEEGCVMGRWWTDGVMWPQSKECQGPPEAGGGLEGSSPRILGGSMAVMTP